MDWYPLLRLAHVIAAVVAVGSNLTYVVWLRAADADPDRLRFAITTIRRIDRRLAIPGYIALLATGVVMVLVGPWAFFAPGTGWITLGLTIYVAIAATGIAVFAPTLRRYLPIAEADATGETATMLRRRLDRLFGLTTGSVLAILWLMVVKPF